MLTGHFPVNYVIPYQYR